MKSHEAWVIKAENWWAMPTLATKKNVEEGIKRAEEG